MFKIVHETYSLILCFALANAFKPLTVFWLNQEVENVKKVNYKFSSSNSFCCCIYSEEYITESLQPEPSFPPHPPDVTWLGMQKNTTVSAGERGTRARSLCRGGQPHGRAKGSQGQSSGQESCKGHNPTSHAKSSTPPQHPPTPRQAHPQKRTLGPRAQPRSPGKETSIGSILQGASLPT